MGTHGRSGFDRLMLGSVAEKVLRRAPCPVLIVPPRANEATSCVTFARILCAVDFSPASLHALDYATALAAKGGPGVTALHAVRRCGNSGRQERVHDCTEEDGGRNHVEGCDVRAVGQRCQQTIRGRRGVR